MSPVGPEGPEGPDSPVTPVKPIAPVKPVAPVGPITSWLYVTVTGATPDVPGGMTRSMKTGPLNIGGLSIIISIGAAPPLWPPPWPMLAPLRSICPNCSAESTAPCLLSPDQRGL